MAYIDFIQQVHKSTPRNYVERVISVDKADCAIVAKQFGYEFFDGERKYGYGGYNYDGRWKGVAQNLAEYYHLKSGDKVLDIGCGKAYLLYELTKVVPGLQVTGLDVSEYAITHAKEEVRPYLIQGKAQDLTFEDKSFDLVISLNTLHNLKIFDLKKAIQDIERISKEKSYIVVESYRNDREEVNMLYWQLTCASYFAVDEWEWLYHQWGYTGDYGFIFFE